MPQPGQPPAGGERIPLRHDAQVWADQAGDRGGRAAVPGDEQPGDHRQPVHQQVHPGQAHL